MLKIFLGGKKCILRCLLKVKWILERSEKRYLLAIIYLNDFCVWIQNQDEKKIFAISEILSRFAFNKNHHLLESLKLEYLEKIAKENENNIRNPPMEDEDN